MDPRVKPAGDILSLVARAAGYDATSGLAAVLVRRK
jgi:hypothetical protein